MSWRPLAVRLWWRLKGLELRTQQHVETRIGRVSLTPGFPGVQPSPSQSIATANYCLLIAFPSLEAWLLWFVWALYSEPWFSSFWQEHTITSLEFKPQPLLSGYPAIMPVSWLYLLRVPSTLILVLLGAKGECATGLGLQLGSAGLSKLLASLSCP